MKRADALQLTAKCLIQQLKQHGPLTKENFVAWTEKNCAVLYEEIVKLNRWGETDTVLNLRSGAGLIETLDGGLRSLTKKGRLVDVSSDEASSKMWSDAQKEYKQRRAERESQEEELDEDKEVRELEVRERKHDENDLENSHELENALSVIGITVRSHQFSITKFNARIDIDGADREKRFIPVEVKVEEADRDDAGQISSYAGVRKYMSGIDGRSVIIAPSFGDDFWSAMHCKEVEMYIFNENWKEAGKITLSRVECPW